jgi:hypothetical protein
VLRSLKLHQEHHAQWAFASSEKSVKKDVQPVYMAIRLCLTDAKFSAR